jgi:hypothetical protein
MPIVPNFITWSRLGDLKAFTKTQGLSPLLGKYKVLLIFFIDCTKGNNLALKRFASSDMKFAMTRRVEHCTTGSTPVAAYKVTYDVLTANPLSYGLEKVPVVAIYGSIFPKPQENGKMQIVSGYFFNRQHGCTGTTDI